MNPHLLADTGLLRIVEEAVEVTGNNRQQHEIIGGSRNIGSPLSYPTGLGGEGGEAAHGRYGTDLGLRGEDCSRSVKGKEKFSLNFHCSHADDITE